MAGPGTAFPEPRGPGGARRYGPAVQAAERRFLRQEALVQGRAAARWVQRLPGARIARPSVCSPAMQRFTVNIKLPARTLTGALSAPNRGAADW